MPSAPPGGQSSALQRPEADDPRAQQGRRFDIVVHLREGVGVRLVDDEILGIAAVDVPAGEEGRDAEILAIAPAEPTHAARAREPRHADAVAERETTRAVTQLLDGPDGFVTGHDVAPLRRQVAFGEVQVGAAHAARMHAHSHLTGSGHRVGPVDELERAVVDRPRIGHYPRAHRARCYVQCPGGRPRRDTERGGQMCRRTLEGESLLLNDGGRSS